MRWSTLNAKYTKSAALFACQSEGLHQVQLLFRRAQPLASDLCLCAGSFGPIAIHG